MSIEPKVPTADANLPSELKVYELAKELGLDSFALIEKLRELNIEVKSHMSSLGASEIITARTHLGKPVPKAKKDAAKTTAVRRKATKTAAEPAADKKAAATTTVIRRRAKGSESDAASEEYAQPAEEAQLHQHVVEAPSSESASAPTTEEQVAASTTPIESTAVKSRSPLDSIRITRKAADHPSEPPTITQTPARGPREAPERPRFSTSTPSGLKMPSLLGSKASGGTATRSSSIINIVKEDPRKSLPRSQPGGRPATGNALGHSNVRPAAAPPSAFVKQEVRIVEEDPFAKKKGPGKGEKEKEATDVNFQDYRAKKELVFLPKKKKVPLNKEIRKTEITTPAAHKRIIKVQGSITVADLAGRMGIKAGQMMQKLMGMGVMATINQSVDLDTATLLAGEYGFEIENVAFKEEAVIPKVDDKAEDLKPRPPVVTVMGHVDHGKTSLLDAIRSANVAAGEAGGITQHIGAYTVQIDGKDISFIDTPGHEAFTMMRARGANVTDLVILVVAADDGVMPQTREAVDHARAAGVPIIVAVNKIDKAGANPEKVIKGLSELNLIPEAWGGDTMFVNVSAIKRTGIKELLENILLQAEVLDLKANPNRLAEGTVLEARLDRSRGALATVLVKKGTLRIGDPIVAGTACGKVRALMDDKGNQLKEVPPGFAAELLGLEDVSTAGDQFYAMESESEARDLAGHRTEKHRAATAAKSARMSLDDLFAKAQEGQIKELPVILKTDVVGSTEAIRDSVSRLATEKVKVKVIHASTGGISESDVMLAAASNAIIIGFNVRPETKARALAESEKIEIKCYSIIYELLEEMKKAMAGILDKKAVEKYLGRAEVRNTFVIPKAGTVAGCAVVDGKILRATPVRVLRDNRIIYTGKLSSLRRFKDDVKEVAQGYECGMGVENFNDIKVGDVIEAFQIDMIAQDIGTATALAK